MPGRPARCCVGHAFDDERATASAPWRPAFAASRSVRAIGTRIGKRAGPRSRSSDRIGRGSMRLDERSRFPDRPRRGGTATSVRRCLSNRRQCGSLTGHEHAIPGGASRGRVMVTASRRGARRPGGIVGDHDDRQRAPAHAAWVTRGWQARRRRRQARREVGNEHDGSDGHSASVAPARHRRRPTNGCARRSSWCVRQFARP